MGFVKLRCSSCTKEFSRYYERRFPKPDEEVQCKKCIKDSREIAEILR